MVIKCGDFVVLLLDLLLSKFLGCWISKMEVTYYMPKVNLGPEDFKTEVRFEIGQKFVAWRPKLKKY